MYRLQVGLALSKTQSKTFYTEDLKTKMICKHSVFHWLLIYLTSRQINFQLEMPYSDIRVYNAAIRIKFFELLSVTDMFTQFQFFDFSVIRFSVYIFVFTVLTSCNQTSKFTKHLAEWKTLHLFKRDLIS